MVLYFSATGNTEFIAREIARGLNDTCINLLDRVKRQDHAPLHSETPFILCAPVYVCEMPRFLSQYLRQQTFTGSRDIYCVFTSGGYCGISGPHARGIFKKKGMNWRGHAEFKMPRNYVASEAYPMLSPEEVRERILASCQQLPSVISDIQAGRNLTARHVFFFETLITLPFNPVWCKFKMPAKDFHTAEKCIGCGKCVKLCPLNNISLQDRKPVWGNHCTHCMACIGNCPTEAIEYGTITQNKEKYNFGKYRHVVEKLPDRAE